MSVPRFGFACALTAPTLQPPRTATPNGLITAPPSAVRAASAAMSAISAKRENSHDRPAIHSHRQSASLHRDARNPAQRFPRLPRMSLSGVSAQPWKLPIRQALTLNATPFDDLQLRSSKTASRKLVIFTPQLTALPISLTMISAP